VRQQTCKLTAGSSQPSALVVTTQAITKEGVRTFDYCDQPVNNSAKE